MGIDIEVKMHGLMGKIYKKGFPKINSLEVIHNDERLYLIKSLPKESLRVSSLPEIRSHKNIVIIFLRQGLHSKNISSTAHFSQSQLLEMIKFFDDRGFEVFIKLHPYSLFEENELHPALRERNFINSQKSAVDVCAKYCPKYVMGWLSTSLVEALKMGIIPITLERKPYESDTSKKSIFNFEKRVLNFESDIDKIELSTGLAQDYNRVLSSLRE